MTKPLNVLFITPDQWRGECLSALGHPTVRTPHIDALAADGVQFTGHFSQCSPCGPSRASLLTGMYLMNHRSVRNGTPLDGRFTNLALEARKTGYDPGLIGYTDTSVDPRNYDSDHPVLRAGYEGVLPGFTPLLLMPTQPVAWVRHLADKGYDVPEVPFDAFKPENGHEAVGGFGPFDAPARLRAEDSDTAYCADTALDFISRERRNPWFLHLVFLRPHPPYIAPAPYNRLYRPEDVPGFSRAATAEEEARQHPFLELRLYGKGSVAHMDEREQRLLRATYYGMMTEVDDHIGRIVAYLKENGLYDDTLIVVTSDHGDTLGDHWLVGKETYFDSVYYVPLVVRAPGRAYDAGRGRVVDAFTENVDVMPTILDLIGCEVPVQCDGHSLAPFLDGGAPQRWRREVHWEYDFRDVDDASAEVELGLTFDQCALAVIRDRRYKYVHFSGLPPLFFDIANDPGELCNLADDPAHGATVLDYAQRMLSWRMAHGERTLTGMKLTPGGLVELSRARR
ncbi:MAG: alkaline phosphatase family protein [Alphaproteobacteria bacterium]